MKKWTYRQTCFCLIGSTLATLAISIGSYAIWRKCQKSRLIDERFKIAAIVQTGPEKEALKTAYLAELIGLSADRPAPLYAFDPHQAESALLACPLISAAKVKRAPPATIYIDYTVRKPVAWLADYQNVAIDREGYLFPIAPFFSPKEMPEIYLGLPPFASEADSQGRSGGAWQTPLESKHLCLAFEILESLEEAPWRENLRVKRIDVSNAFAESYGQREIVLFTEEELQMRKGEKEVVCLFPKIVRLAPREYAQQIANFLSLRRSMLEDYKRQMSKESFTSSSIHFSPRIIDLRIPQLAYVQNQ